MNISKRNRKVCRVVLIPMPQVKEGKVVECEITQEWNGSIPPSFFSFFFIETPEVCSSVSPVYAQLLL